MEILIAFIVQIVLVFLVVGIFGLILHLCRRLFCKIAGTNGYRALLITGCIGTPIHELSHAFFCVIFGHKITEMKLYQPNNENGTLGYVNHTYNPKNIYHQIGNFFIGIAPLIGGSLVMTLMMFLLLPDVFFLSWNVNLPNNFLSLNTVDSIVSIFTRNGYALFNEMNLKSWQWWVFIVLGITITSHMELSLSDIKSSLKGLPFILIFVVISDVIMYFVSISALNSVTQFITSCSSIMIEMFSIGILFSLMMVAGGSAVKGIGKIVKVIINKKAKI